MISRVAFYEHFCISSMNITISLYLAENFPCFDSQDLLSVCRELNLEDSLDELMRELGADENGRISYQEFLRRRLALRPEIDAIRSNSTSNIRHQCAEYLPTSSDNSFGKCFHHFVLLHISFLFAMLQIHSIICARRCSICWET